MTASASTSAAAAFSSPTSIMEFQIMYTKLRMRDCEGDGDRVRKGVEDESGKGPSACLSATAMLNTAVAALAYKRKIKGPVVRL